MMMQKIVVGSMHRSFRATQRSIGLSIRQSSTIPTPPRYEGKVPRYLSMKDYVGDRYKGNFKVATFSGQPELNSYQQKLRQSVHSALQKERIDVHEWPALQDFIVRSIIRDKNRAMYSLKEMLLDLGYEHQHFFTHGSFATDPLFIQMSPESESSILQIYRIVSKVLPELPRIVAQLLFERYYVFGLHSYSEQLLDIVEGLDSLTSMNRSQLLSTRLRCRRFRDYWEAFAEYRKMRDWCLERGIREIFPSDEWFRVLYNLIRVDIYDTESTPSLPVEILEELMTDYDNLAQEKEHRRLTMVTLALNHYGKSASKAVGSKWRMYHQQVITIIHEGLVKRYGDDLNGDVAIFNSLLEAYGRAGLFNSAIEIWNQMVNSNVEISAATLAIIFDHCGLNGRLSDAIKIFESLQHGERFLELMEKNIWDSWLECLCRCGALQEAIDFTFHLMEPKLRERAEVYKNTETMRTVTTTKERYYKRIESELTKESDLKYPDKQDLEFQSQQLRKYSSKGLSIYAPDAKTFKLLLGFSHVKHKQDSYGFTQPELHAELLQRLHQDYPNLVPFIEDRLLVPI
ncbi:uncharacterized protein FA14DRAFT_152328 [Meira miltonrushii]|uniref:Pentatricopeptide repeat-containing protein n=1 Tax=Meira miltonrushii TaxID=1280837 RepID=A0A316VH84_9BASI|nr:uncharacterized protein FA14DRAFT_152328 [Meira miltonrushii]PWN36906.1 hypothetical protein FA14DRAFT_152328 [Meira miltonrushii]